MCGRNDSEAAAPTGSSLVEANVENFPSTLNAAIRPRSFLGAEQSNPSGFVHFGGPGPATWYEHFAVRDAVFVAPCMPVAKRPSRSFRDTDWDTRG